MPDQHLPRALGNVLHAAREAQKQAYAHYTHPGDAARAFFEAVYIGMSLLDLASAIRFHIRDIVEDPDTDLTDTQRRAYEEVHAEFNYLAKRCIGLSTGMSRAATALDHLAEVTRKHPNAKI
ncbi:hypothetical protein [Saccharopolyspora sp. NPDC050642]|uniref:hypothetical protein n=1 Tax=Saccharopolyspora sp. NPDC050642 TaxID=3157099 RepID=UPI0033C7613E